MKKIFVIIGFILFSFFPLCLPPKIFADAHFSVTTQANYDISENGITHVALGVTLTNMTDQFYPSSYTISLSLPSIENVTATNTIVPITPTVKNLGDVQEITIPFSNKVLGMGKVTKFIISFDTPDIVSLRENIREINIPGIANQNQFALFNVHVVIPPSFGTPTYVKPPMRGTTLDYTKDQLGTSGIAIAFGEKQAYQLSLLYHIKNTSIIPLLTEIALPPTTNYQTVDLRNISPKPLTITRDGDGNWLAQYFLFPSQTMTVSAVEYIGVSLNGEKQPLSETERKIYTQEQPYWQTENDEVRSLAQSLKTPEAIYDYVTTHLSYDYSRVTAHQIRLGAINILQNPQNAVCLEFTDAFIALARAAGIPAREVDGYAFTNNSKQRPLSLIKDVLHAWPEYYDLRTNQWVMVDPTWENTTSGVDYFHTFDFDHVAFVVRGVHSEYPIPAGGYKLADSQETKDVSVVFAQNSPMPKPVYTVSVKGRTALFQPSLIQGAITIQNNSPVLISGGKLTLVSDALVPQSKTISYGDIPPLSKDIAFFTWEKPSTLTKTATQITIQDGRNVYHASVSLRPFIFNNTVLIGGGLFAASIIIILSFIAVRTRRLPFH